MIVTVLVQIFSNICCNKSNTTIGGNFLSDCGAVDVMTCCILDVLGRSKWPYVLGYPENPLPMVLIRYNRSCSNVTGTDEN
jgi:hypothetical protein